MSLIISTRTKALFAATLLWSVAMLLNAADARAQGCCAASGAGSVTGTAAQGVSGLRQFDFSVFYERFNLNETINEDGAPIFTDGNRAQTTTVNVSLSYGWSDRLTTTAIVGYFDRSRNFAVQGLGGAGSSAVSADGIGDLTLLAKFALLPYHPERPHEVSLGAGIKLPLGDDGESRSGLSLPVDVQSGSGSTDFLFWGRLFRQIGAFSVSGNVTWTLTGESDNAQLGNYEFGDALTYESSISRPVMSNLEIGVNAIGRWSASDRSLDLLVFNTGGNRLFAGPLVAWSPFGHAFTLHGALLLPVFENVSGLQQGLTSGIRFGTQYQFGIL